MFASDYELNYYSEIKEESISGRYIHYALIEPLLLKHHSVAIGASELNNPIHKIQIGSGKKKILIWSQMHGNESTGTKAMFDVLNYLSTSKNKTQTDILKNCTILFIPMLNPDGALAYTRVNANNIDLNRDAVDLKAKESQLLRKILDDFQPQFCFNLHDQRTIFGVEGTKNSAILSFLAPSINENRDVTKGRVETMNVIAAVNDELQNHIPNQIGRYTDEFYPTATGDNFQKLGYNTILIESGHHPNDYDREITRKYTYLSILKGLHHISMSSTFDDKGSYLDIPNNSYNFFDVIHRYPDQPDRAFQFKEMIINGEFTLRLEKVPNLDAGDYLAHKEIVFAD